MKPGHPRHNRFHVVGIPAELQSNTEDVRARGAILAANLDVLARQHPALYDALIEDERAGLNRRYIISADPRTIEDTKNPGVPCTPDEDPRSRISTLSLDDMVGICEQHAIVVVAGVGDGTVLAHLNAVPRRTEKRSQGPALLIVEPDLALFQACLSLHDLTDGARILADERAHFVVGPDWAREVDDLLREARFALPSTILLGGRDREHVRDTIEQHVLAIRNASADTWIEVWDRYAHTTAHELLEVFGDAPPRAPRIFGHTSRASPVLVRTMRELFDALERRGWKTWLFMEEREGDRLSPVKTIDAIDQFSPDIVLICNFLRCDRAYLFPPGLPVLAWIQDHTPHVDNYDTGATIGWRDYIAIGEPHYLARDFGYPASQITNLRCLTHMRDLEPLPGSFRFDLVYVSNQLRSDDWLRWWASDWAKIMSYSNELAQAALQRVMELYQDGGEIDTLDLPDYCKEHFGTADIATSLYLPVIMLYRRRGLRWAVRMAKEHGIRLGIYGDGWRDLPEFAAYAEGYVAPGEPLMAVLRCARFSLAVEPWCMTSHMRGLDAIACGSIPLFRHHSGLDAPIELRVFCEQHGIDAPNVLVAREQLPEQLHAEFNARLRAFSFTGLLGDAIEATHRVLGDGTSPGPWDTLYRSCFDSYETMVARYTSCTPWSKPSSPTTWAQSILSVTFAIGYVPKAKRTYNLPPRGLPPSCA